MKTKILLVDDHAVLRKGLRLLLKDEKDINVVGEAGDGRTAIDMVRKLSPHIVVMDITMPDLSGTEATKRILSKFPNTKIIALSIHSGNRFVENMLEAGAAGYILKESAPEELVKGIRAVIDGKAYLSPSITAIALSRFREAPSGTQVSREKPERTEQEKEVLRLLMEGNTTEQIASVLKITTRKVNAAQKKLMKKLGVNSMAELTEYVRSGVHDKKGPAGDNIHHAYSSTITSVPIIGTKLHRPAISGDHVLRSRLVEQLNHNRKHPLVLISAPAGYGKSTLASSWIETCDWPNAWLSLDADDSDLRIFLSYLMQAVQSMFPKALPKTGDMLNAAVLPPLPVLAGLLINELEMIEQDFVLVIDDFHLINDTPVLDLITEVLRHPPRPMHLVLIGRKDPFLPISVLRSRKQIYELRIEEIRFTAAETTAYLQQILKETVDDASASAWAEKTEGWITGLRLAALSIQHRKDFKSMLSELDGGAQYVMEYLFHEVLSHLQPGIRDILLKTSILDRFCAPLCSAVCRQEIEQGKEEADSWEFISYLKKENLFIINLDAEGRWFRYHHLFQQLLQNQLKRYHSPEEIALLHSRTGEWFESQGLITESINHMLKAGDPLRAAEIIEANRDSEFIADRWFVIDRWLKMLPSNIKQERPKLLLTEAWILYLQHLLARIPMLLDQAESLLRSQTAEPVELAEITFFRGYIAYFEGEAEQSLKYLGNAVSTLAGTKSPVLGDTELVLGLARCMNGNKDLAVQALEGRINEVHSSEGQLISRLIASLTFIYLICGDLQQARVEAQRLQIVAKKFSMPLTQAWSSYMWACSLLHTGEFNAALPYFAQVYEQRYVLEPMAALDALTGLALTQQLMGLDDEARESARMLAKFVHELDEPLYIPMIHSCYARLSLLRGDLKSAVEQSRLITGTPSPANLFMWLESPPITQARVLIATGSAESLERATGLLYEIRQMSEACRFTCQTIEVAVLQSLALERQSRPDEALAILKETVALAQSGGWIRPFVELGAPMADLLKRLAKKKVAVDLIRHILAAFRTEKTETVQGITNDNTVRLQALHESLSKRELETLSLLGQGLSNKEIAEKLFLSPETVKKHVYNIYQKLYVKSRVSAIAKAKELGIL